ncbi:MAG: hypothetical protein QOJ73_331 [Streptosporangiaceae bacterium]|jgi:hypothetical protein|nr:hypothetical protein [Streptosporangiaceae bacterium]
MIVAVTKDAGDQSGSEAWHDKLEQLPHVSAAERRQIIDDYLATVLRDVPPQLQARARRSLPDLPEHPAPAQVSAWLDAAGYFRGPVFRQLARQVTPVLEAEASLLRESSELLLAQGEVSIARSAAVVRATLRTPSRWRPGAIHTSAERADGSVSARSVMPLPAQMEPASMLSEITLQLAIALASLEE